MKNDFENLTYGGLVALIMAFLLFIVVIVTLILILSGVDVMGWIFRELRL